MRSTDGLCPKIGRVVEPAPGLTPQRPAAAATPALPRAGGQLARAGALEPQLGLGGRRAEPPPPAPGNPEDALDWDRVISNFKFLMLPAAFAVLIMVLGVKLPRVALYGVAAIIGVAALAKARKDPEILLALMLIYIPFAHLYAISIAPLVNGTNIFILLCLFTGVATAAAGGYRAFGPRPGFVLITAWFVLSSASIFTLVRTPGALSYTVGTELTQYTAWLSQAGFYLAVYSLIKTRGQAKRAVVYVMFGTTLVVLFGLREAIDKIGLNSIEKQRLGGVFEQPNDFGGFIAYTSLPFIALFVFNMGRVKAWLMTPYFLLTLKVLITTFSRGAYAAFVIGGLAVGWARGKLFLIGWGVLAVGFVLMFPQVLPDSVLDRLNHTGRTSKVEKLDKSSEDRLIMWNAAIDMTLENPITGKGFKAFPYLKGLYTERPVREADPHNMYLYISSQMGIPTLLVFLAFMAYLAWMGAVVRRRSYDEFERAIGASVFAIVACMAVINMFGSRMVGMSYVGYFYTLAVVIQVLYTPHARGARSTRVGGGEAADTGAVAAGASGAAAPSARQPSAAGLGVQRAGAGGQRRVGLR